MKKISIMIMLVMAGVFAQAQTSVWDGSRQLWTRGTGTESDPYLIESAEQLAFLSYMVGKAFDTHGLYFKLTTDIDLNGSEDNQWIPIGLSKNAYYEDGCERNAAPVGINATDLAFKGHFDGGDHSISNIYVNSGQDAAGLFGVLANVEGSQTVVENVFVTSGFIKGVNVGGIAGNCILSSESDILISRCWNGAEIDGTYAGGIVGNNADKIRNCYNIAAVKGTSAAGGMVASSANELTECYNNGAVTSNSFCGGILGGNVSGKTVVSNCYNTGDVFSTGSGATSSLPACPVGGIVGMVWMGTHSMTNCYNVGSVSCETCDAGALVGGFGNSGTVENAYFLMGSGADNYGEAKTAEEMREPSFVDILNNGTDVWCADTLSHNNGFPILGKNNLAVEEYAWQTLNVYPNPSNGQFTAEGNGTLRVFNALGQLVVMREIREKAVLDLPKGLYFVRLDGAEGMRMAKLVVK